MREIGVPQTPRHSAAHRGADLRGRRREQPARTGHRRPPPDLPHRPARPRSALARRSHRQRAHRLAIPVRSPSRTGESALTVDGTLTRHDPDVAVDLRPGRGGTARVAAGDRPLLPGGVVPDLHPRLTVGVVGHAGRAGPRRRRHAVGGRAREGRAHDRHDGARPRRHGPPRRGRRRPRADRQVTATRPGRITGDATFDLRFPSATEGFPIDGTLHVRRPARRAPTATRAPTSRRPGRSTAGTSGSTRQRTPTEERRRREGTIARAGRGQRELAARPGRAGHARRPAQAAARRCAIPALETDLTGTYAVPGPLSALKADAVLAASTVEGATLADGTIGRFARTAARLHVRRGGHRGGARPAASRRGAAGAGDDRAAPGRGRQRHVRRDGRAARAATDCASRRPGRSPTRRRSGAACRRWRSTSTLDDDRLDVAAQGARRGLRTRDAHRHAVGDRRAARARRRARHRARRRRVSIDTIGVDGTVTLDSVDAVRRAVRRRVDGRRLPRQRAGDRPQRLDGKGDGFTLTGSGVVGPRRRRCLRFPVPARRRLAGAAGEDRRPAADRRGHHRGPRHGQRAPTSS